ncbi:RNA recognition motif domain-containing protein [Ditylenchus destructor]|uniref:RNA recognition motif domain-containing protein n=1 Tax=Ditylenchus destructor TaxID=166010 RepID=A0AAD4R443_9BILA|nr:RNA recognition motif domain-containing protein [Ditylenchus destructor]
MSVLRCALQRGVLNARILNGILRCLERQSTFNSFYISRPVHTGAKNGESGNTSRSAQNYHPGYTKPKIISRGAFCFKLTPSNPTDPLKNRRFSTPKPPEHCRIFVSGLSKFTTEGSMRAYFRKFGSVKGCSIDRDQSTGLPKKTGYVEFEFNGQANRAIESFPHVIDGQEVDVRPYFNQDDYKKNQIIVRGLPQDTSQMQLSNFYSQFGQVLNCKIIRDEGNVSRGYAFVSFKSGEAVDLALNSLPHLIDDIEISDVKRIRGVRKRELTLRVFDLSPETTEESLREFYSRFGQLTRCELRLNPKTEVRYGTVAFSKQEELDRALDAEPHVIDGSEVFLTYLTSELDLRIRAVPEGVTIESVEKFFSKYGELRDCRFNKSMTGQNNAYVSFVTKNAVNRALADRPHFVEGKLVNTTFANRVKPAAFSLVVGSLPENATEKSLIEAFSKFGKLVYWKIYNAEKQSQSTPCGLVSYGTPEEALNALNSGPHMIEGMTLDVRKANEPIEQRRIIVSGLSKFTTEESIRKYFCKFGTVKGCDIDLDQYTGLSKKTGYVEFVFSDQANRAVESFSHVIDGQEIDVHPYFNKGDHKKNQISVRGLPKETSQMTLRKFYSQFGQVVYCKIIRDEGNVSRGYAFVSFESGDAVDLALNSLPHRIDDIELSDVQRAHVSKRELTLRVFDLSPETTEESLREFYSKFGQLTRCDLARNPNTGELQHGFVAFETQEELDHAIKAQPHVIDGSKVFLTYWASELDLCVKAIPEGVTKESLEKFFSKYGELRGFRFEKTLSGNGIAYVHFATLDAVDRALAGRPHIVEGKLVNTYFANKAKQATFSLFIGSLPENATEKSLVETFTKFGKLVYWQFDGKRFQSTPYGFVSYGTVQEALTALNNGPHLIEGTTLDVRKAKEVVALLKEEEESDEKSEN